jgi:hypothetical protein
VRHAQLRLEREPVDRADVGLPGEEPAQAREVVRRDDARAVRVLRERLRVEPAALVALAERGMRRVDAAVDDGPAELRAVEVEEADGRVCLYR